MHDFHHFMLALMMAFAMTFSTVEVIKLTAGRLRPDYLDRVELFGGGMDDLDVRYTANAALAAMLWPTPQAGGTL